MNERTLAWLVISTAFVLAIPTLSPALTREPVEPEPGIVSIALDADSVLIYHIASDSIPRCEWDTSDSLRFSHCYPILEQGSAPGRDWREDLGDLLSASPMLFWNRDGCGYMPQAIVRFVKADRVSQLVVFTGRCDSSRVGLLMIQPGAPMEYRELGKRGEALLDLLAEALPNEPSEENPFASEGTH